MTNFLKGSLAAAMFASTMAAAPAFANDSDAVAMALVEYGDLDLSTERGQDRLHNRLRSAAQYACGMDIRSARSLLPSRQARECYTEKMRGFERQVTALIGTETRRG
ncbi:UrcA family protein [Aurantiacibacter marinus]|uniref:UrcA family protein n=1 Tax=Aurantiacibacter marinus TaxID=874156 RepID=A0A0H0XM55_9SPHN|nr:UrcA family protein [Aurantiacibacter marinus]KLI63693.1 hypothetical protein AAV99_08140 [Aurantiacibacter marinus]